MKLPRYPVYIPSKGRPDRCLTADMFTRDQVPFRLVVEESDADAYRSHYPNADILVLPFSNVGSVIPARNWIKQHATAEGAARHWQFDDNIRSARRVHDNKRLYCRSGIALAVCEDFTDRYTNVAISGFQYTMFAPVATSKLPPFTINQHVYSCSLINNQIPHEWRGRYNEDTDICLQVLADGWTTILLNAFLMDKMPTMTMKGGNTTALYDENDGRLRMARSLERNWPGVVETRRRFQRPQHVVKADWRRFDTPLIRRPDFNLADEPSYDLKLTATREVQSPRLKRLIEE